jgi:hypothetical protein
VALRVRVVPFRTAWAVIPAGRGAVSTTDWMRRPTAPASGAAPSLTGRSSVRVIWSGHAHLGAADEEGRANAERHGRAGLRRGRNLDRDGQEDLALITEIGQSLQSLALGQGPDDVAGRDACGQGPAEGRRAAGVARIAPVGVPAGLNLLPDRDHRRRSRRGPGRHRDQFGLDPLGLLRARGGLRPGRPRDEGQTQQKKGEKAQGGGPDRSGPTYSRCDARAEILFRRPIGGPPRPAPLCGAAGARARPPR